MQRRGELSTSARRIAYDDATPPPTPHIPDAITDAPLMLLDLEPLEVARQLTLMESGVLRDIHPKDLLMHGLRNYRGSAWQRTDTSAVSILLRQADEVCAVHAPLRASYCLCTTSRYQGGYVPQSLTEIYRKIVHL